MRIILCPSAYAPHIGGVEELTYRLASEYQSQGHQVLIVTSRWPLNLPRYEVIRGIEVQRINYVMPHRRLAGLVRFVVFFPLQLFSLGRLISHFRPEIVHIQCVSAQGFYLLLLKPLLRFHLVVTLQGEWRMDAHQLYQRSRLMRWMLARLLRTADYVTACSQATLADVQELWPPNFNSRVIPNGISLKEFEKLPATAEVKPIRPYLFATGRQVSNKGFDLLIEAFSRLVRHYPEVDLIIGGAGSVHEALKQQIIRLGLSERVYLPGYLDRSQTIAYFRECLFFVLPSRYEPFGIVNLEAMASAKAVIATNVGGVAEIIKPGEIGLLVLSEDVEALASAMRRLLDNPEVAAAMGQEGRRQVEATFTWPGLANQYLQLYGQLDLASSNLVSKSFGL